MANEATINGVHVHDVQYGRTTRKSFARIPDVLEMPNLIEVQKKSYEWFLNEGLREYQKQAAPSAGLRCRPLRAKGKAFAKIDRSFVILS